MLRAQMYAYMGAYGGQDRVSDLLASKFTLFSYELPDIYIYILRTELESSARTTSSLNH